MIKSVSYVVTFTTEVTKCPVVCYKFFRKELSSKGVVDNMRSRGGWVEAVNVSTDPAERNSQCMKQEVALLQEILNRLDFKRKASALLFPTDANLCISPPTPALMLLHGGLKPQQVTVFLLVTYFTYSCLTTRYIPRISQLYNGS